MIDGRRGVPWPAAVASAVALLPLPPAHARHDVDQSFSRRNFASSPEPSISLVAS
jgi:hypothetical protein